MEDPASKAAEFLKEIAAAQSPAELEQIRIKLLGRNGAITALMRGLGQLPAEQRREAGATLNTLRDEVTAALEEAGDRLRRAALANRLAENFARMKQNGVAIDDKPPAEVMTALRTAADASIADWLAKAGPDAKDVFEGYRAKRQ